MLNCTIYYVLCMHASPSAISSSEGLNLTADNVTVALREPALLNCTLTGFSEPDDVSIVIRKMAGFYAPDK